MNVVFRASLDLELSNDYNYVYVSGDCACSAQTSCVVNMLFCSTEMCSLLSTIKTSK